MRKKLVYIFCSLGILFSGELIASERDLQRESKLQMEMESNFPISTDKKLVLAACAEKKWDCETWENTGYLKQGTKEIVGKKYVYAKIFDKREGFFTVSVVSHFGFDENDRLVGIWVWLTKDGL